MLIGPKNRFALGRVAFLGCERELQTDRPDNDVLKLKFRETGKVASEELAGFLSEHLDAVVSNGSRV